MLLLVLKPLRVDTPLSWDGMGWDGPGWLESPQAHKGVVLRVGTGVPYFPAPSLCVQDLGVSCPFLLSLPLLSLFTSLLPLGIWCILLIGANLAAGGWGTVAPLTRVAVPLTFQMLGLDLRGWRHLVVNTAPFLSSDPHRKVGPGGPPHARFSTKGAPGSY